MYQFPIKYGMNPVRKKLNHSHFQSIDRLIDYYLTLHEKLLVYGIERGVFQVGQQLLTATLIYGVGDSDLWRFQ